MITGVWIKPGEDDLPPGDLPSARPDVPDVVYGRSLMQRPQQCVRCRRGPMQTRRAPATGGVRHMARGLCASCYHHVHEQGRLHTFPALRAPRVDHRAVVDAFLELEGHGLSKLEIARRIGVGRGVMYDALSRDPRIQGRAPLPAEELLRLRRSIGLPSTVYPP